MILPRKSNLVLLTATGAGVVGDEVLSSLVGVSCCNQTEEWDSLLFYLTWSHMNKWLKVRYLIKKIDRDIIKKGHISSSVLLSVHRLLGWFQQTPQPDTFVHVCFCDNNHSPGTFILLLILLLIVRVASRGKTSPSSDPISKRTVSKSSFTGGREGKSQSKRRKGEGQTS